VRGQKKSPLKGLNKKRKRYKTGGYDSVGGLKKDNRGERRERGLGRGKKFNRMPGVTSLHGEKQKKRLGWKKAESNEQGGGKERAACV